MKKILHISPHLGGGVGRVLLNYLGYAIAHEEDSHELFCLDYVNPATTQTAKELGIPLKTQMTGCIHELLRAVSNADLVVIHWWNHPLLHALLMRETLPPSRVLVWSHVSGYTPTQCITDALVAYPDLFVIAAPYSREVPAIQRLSPEERDSRVRLVFSCAGIRHVESVEPRPHDGFNIGYVGAVDYWKLHRNFICMSAAATIPAAHFIVCGGPQEASLQKDAEEAGFGDLFEFRGHTEDVAQALSTFDIFGYPINPGQSGTGEQALIEALAAGVPPVVLDNGAERYIVEDGVTGIIAKNEAEYALALEFLYRNPDKRLLMTTNARESARKRFTLDNTVREWRKVYDEVMQLPKRQHSWPNHLLNQASAAELFLESLGEHGGDFAITLRSENVLERIEAEGRIAELPEIFRSETRGSVFHYRSVFPEDPFLNYWSGLIRPSITEQ